ncbi:hypothetical protein J437_LFUL009652 [Ladona fulva]|uniref:Uncharacterized protein n=1 Tax=Ladona fulva TaxID=123851 RepID=A0A8K0KCU5_LADFU|nr:hypothetical protein J437_LFUL009652 [Ladona fulva]
MKELMFTLSLLFLSLSLSPLFCSGETGDVEHMIQEDATATISTTMRGSEFYQMQDPEATSEYIAGQPTTQSRVVTTRTHTRTVMGEDGRPVTVTTTETEVGDVSGAEGILDNNQLRESMQQIIDQFAAGEESKEGKGKEGKGKEEKPE